MWKSQHDLALYGGANSMSFFTSKMNVKKQYRYCQALPFAHDFSSVYILDDSNAWVTVSPSNTSWLWTSDNQWNYKKMTKLCDFPKLPVFLCDDQEAEQSLMVLTQYLERPNTAEDIRESKAQIQTDIGRCTVKNKKKIFAILKRVFQDEHDAFDSWIERPAYLDSYMELLDRGFDGPTDKQEPRRPLYSQADDRVVHNILNSMESRQLESMEEEELVAVLRCIFFCRTAIYHKRKTTVSSLAVWPFFGFNHVTSSMWLPQESHDQFPIGKVFWEATVSLLKNGTKEAAKSMACIMCFFNALEAYDKSLIADLQPKISKNTQLQTYNKKRAKKGNMDIQTLFELIGTNMIGTFRSAE